MSDPKSTVTSTMSGAYTKARGYHFKLGPSTGSLGIIGIVVFIIAFVLLWKHFLGKYSTWVAFALMIMVPLLDL
jgi:uncharacterized protein (DUF983 family)